MTFTLSLSTNDGKVSVAAEGEIYKNSCRLSYVFDGAEYCLTADEDGIVSVRYGDCQMEIGFRRSGESVAKIGIGDECGYAPVKTLSLKTAFYRYGCRLSAEYVFGGETRRTEIVAVRSIL